MKEGEQKEGFCQLDKQNKERILRAIKQAYLAVSKVFPESEKEQFAICDDILLAITQQSNPPEEYDKNGFRVARRLNIYTDGDGNSIITVDVNLGVTPFVTFDKRVNKHLKSLCYLVPQDIEPSHEWYKPTHEEVLTLPKELKEHVANNGLLLRLVGAEFVPKHKDNIKNLLRAGVLNKN